MGKHFAELKVFGTAIFVAKLSSQQWQFFYQHLQHLLLAGLTLLAALTLLAHHGADAEQRGLALQLSAMVVRGPSLTMAARLSQLFTDLDLRVLETGELAGQLPQVLALLAKHHQRQHQVKMGLVKALAYPGLVMFFSAMVLSFMLVWIVPQFAHVFVSFEIPLPWLTRTLMALSQWAMPVVSGFILLSVAAGWSLGWLWVKKRHYVESVLMLAPVSRSFWRLTVCWRFCQSLGLLLKAGVPLLQALPASALASNSALCQTAVLLATREVQRGVPLHQAFERQGFFLPAVIALFALGESSGCLDDMLLQQATFLEQQLDAYVFHFNRWLEPMVLMATGIMVGVMVVALYLPIFELGKAFH